MSDPMQKDDCCKGCYYEERSYTVDPCKECSRAFSGMQKDWYTKEEKMMRPGAVHTPVPPIKVDWKKLDKEVEEKFLTKLIDDHWAYIEALLIAHGNELDAKICEFHYKSAFKHGFKHCREWMEGK